MQKGRTDEAFKEIQESLRLDPGFAQAYNNLGALYGSKGRFEEAVGAFQKAVSQDPGNEIYVKNLEASQQGVTKLSKPQTMANPASLNCVKLGGKVEILRDESGNETGYCRFQDGRLCEEWALYREGKCIPPKK